VTVALGGDGGDEKILPGNNRRYNARHYETGLRKKQVSSIRKVGRIWSAGPLYPALAWAPRFLRGRAPFKSFAHSAGTVFHRFLFSPHKITRLFTPDFQQSLANTYSRCFRRTLNTRRLRLHSSQKSNIWTSKRNLPDDSSRISLSPRHISDPRSSRSAPPRPIT